MAFPNLKIPKFGNKKSNTSSQNNVKRPPLSKHKKRQYVLAGGLLLLLGLGSMYGSYSYDASQTKKLEEGDTKAKEIKQTDLSKPVDILDGAGILQHGMVADQDADRKRIAQLEQSLLQIQNDKVKGGANATPTGFPPGDLGGKSRAFPGAPSTSQINVGQSVGGNGLPIPLVDSGNLSSKSKIVTVTFGENASNALQNPISGLQQQAAGQVQRGNSIDTVYTKGITPNLVVTGNGEDISVVPSSHNGGLNSTGKFRAQKSYIPTGTFFQAVLLGGLDAPTGGESSTANPHPVLMQITNMAQLPNSFRVNFKKCFVTGTGYGDLSSERAMIRTEQLSCVGTDGRALDIPIKGWIAGDDGKTGVLGRLVSKQGAAIKNALIAGLLSGIGQGFSSAATSTSTSGLGAVSTVTTGKQFQSALGTGTGQAFDKIAQYYVKLADKIFPVVEVNAGRKVNIVLLKGFQIDGE